MSQTVKEKKKYTYEDYLKTPDDKRYELIEGELLMTPSPVTKHQRVSRKIEFLLEKFVTENDLGEIFHAPYDVYLDNENVLQPDILFVSRERSHIIGEKNIQGAPDLVIEIVSESTAYRDLVQKKSLYAKYGVKEYWVVVPDNEIVEVYVLRESLYALHETFRKGDSLDSPTFPEFHIGFTNVFES